MASESERKIEITERAEVPWLSVVLGYCPMLPFAAGAAAAWCASGTWRTEAVLLTTIWAAAILTFLAGARRGLSFRTEGGPTFSQIVTMFVLFVLGLAAPIAITHGFVRTALASVLIGFVGIFVLDPIAARKGQAPLFFARLRRPQIAIAVLSLGALIAKICFRG